MFVLVLRYILSNSFDWSISILKCFFSSICSFADFRLWRKMLITSKFVNETHYLLTLSEGNAGVYCRVADIKHGQSFTCSIDPHSTYREYIITNASAGRLLVTSDDMADFGVITIDCNDQNFRWTGSPRPPVRLPNDKSRRSRFSFLACLRSWFCWWN